MSLTRLLNHNKQIKELFKSIPNMKQFFQKLNEGPAFPVKAPIIVKSDGRANPIVGHAYDYWLRAFIQRINNRLQENDNLVAYQGLSLLFTEKKFFDKDAYKYHLPFIKEEEKEFGNYYYETYLKMKEENKTTDEWFEAVLDYIHEKYTEEILENMELKFFGDFTITTHYSEGEIIYDNIIERRNSYILGESVDDTQLMEDCMILGNLDAFYRSNYIHEQGVFYVSEKDITDLLNLTRETQKFSSLFIMNHTLICNPSFEKASILVGGADADILIDSTLIEIKTESQFGYKADHMRQLIGYYILSLFTPSFPKIDKLAIYNSRFCRYVYINIDDIFDYFDLIGFAKEFIEILLERNSLLNKDKDVIQQSFVTKTKDFQK
ncbi:hypothetical protein CD30_14920 [Ureibacillus massiliensis 4400831 = CIP 108448 = CCUG 49529]|uniref:Restriction endonuclease n=4 Tax=Bacillales TaxID=1385 RepID=A0A0A3J2E8_9BACL|nr:hypothetical protein [Ureibacillus massiliensis]KGR89875.1 hypothetical protein CD30_14920 [Ureibacillus massiliensis 4400831 = CIP 108448 = CCUG 49529]